MHAKATLVILFFHLWILSSKVGDQLLRKEKDKDEEIGLREEEKIKPIYYFRKQNKKTTKKQIFCDESDCFITITIRHTANDRK